ncbi:MAG: hypothetical protein AAGG02_02580 [Cyanobacteria bacterium P01_H01_bin.15]
MSVLTLQLRVALLRSKLKRQILIAVILLACIVPFLILGHSADYMGRALNGEPVYFYSSQTMKCVGEAAKDVCSSEDVAQVTYQVGDVKRWGRVDCAKQQFREVWQGSRLLGKRLYPDSYPEWLVLKSSCSAL